MRPSPLTLCLVALSAACATGAGDGDGWRREQLARVLTKGTARGPAESAPQEPGDPRPIDEREPQGLGIGPRAYARREGGFAVGLGGGYGSVKVRVPDSRLDDRTAAGFGMLTLDSGIGRSRGAGLHVRGFGSDADLFDGRRINDGMVPADADARLVGVDAFPHMRFELIDPGTFVLPLRAGVFADWLSLDHEPALVEREWLSLGPRLALEPAWRIVVRGDRSLELYARAGGDVGGAWFTEEFRDGDDSDQVWRWAGDVAVGLRGTLGPVRAEAGWAFQETVFGTTEGDLFGKHDRTYVRGDQIFFGLRATF